MKKLNFFIVGMLLTAFLISGCSGNNENPDPKGDEMNSESSFEISETDITIETNKIELSDGTWKYDKKMPQNYWEYGTFVVSNKATQLTYTKVYEFKNSYGGEMSQARYEQKNQYPEINMKSDFIDSTFFNDNTITYTIKTNAGKTKFKSILVSGENITTTLLEKIK